MASGERATQGKKKKEVCLTSRDGQDGWSMKCMFVGIGII